MNKCKNCKQLQYKPNLYISDTEIKVPLQAFKDGKYQYAEGYKNAYCWKCGKTTIHFDLINPVII